MCEYLIENKCKITNSACPYMYFCNTTLTWKESKSMPKNCKVKERANIKIPANSYPVVFERKEQLYVKIDGHIVVIENPYKNTIPEFVKCYKTKQGVWRIKK